MSIWVSPMIALIVKGVPHDSVECTIAISRRTPQWRPAHSRSLISKAVLCAVLVNLLKNAGIALICRCGNSGMGRLVPGPAPAPDFNRKMQMFGSLEAWLTGSFLPLENSREQTALCPSD